MNMSIRKISPVAEFLRANHAKAKNIMKHTERTGEQVKTCEFYGPAGNYLGRMSTVLPRKNKKTSFAYLRSYIETQEPGYKAGYRQLKENVIHFAKILGVAGKNETYLPETMAKKQIVIDNLGNKTEDFFERKIASKTKLIKPADKNAYGYVPQNTYLAEEPVKYEEVQTLHRISKSSDF